MKNLALLASFALLAACGTSDDDGTPIVTPAASATATAPPPPQKRTLASGTQLVTSPTNLLLDPGFGLVGGQAGYGMFFTYLATDNSDVTVNVTLDSRSPAGYGGAVALVKPDGATNKQSDPVIMLASFQGGNGPFHGKVWVSKSNIDGAPVDFTADKKTIVATLTDATPDGQAFDMTVTDGATKSIGGRTWVLLQVDVQNPLPYGGYFVLNIGGTGGQIHIAAPEVTAQPLLDGQTTMSLRTSRARGLTPAERSAITKYRAVTAKPRWVPASTSKRAPRHD
ncbi:MAG TPA: hypothetical protein VIF62_20750 [Labilithrix sp.]